MPKIIITFTRAVIDPGAVAASAGDPACGGTALFIGTTRNSERGREVIGLEYEAYEPMARKVIDALSRTAAERWQTGTLAVVHRLGPVGVGEASIVIAAAAPHRREAFEACRFLIDEIKRSAPIWKKELYADGAGGGSWVGLPERPKS